MREYGFRGRGGLSVNKSIVLKGSEKIENMDCPELCILHVILPLLN